MTRRYTVLACDFDGTLATSGWVPLETLAAVARFREAGGRFVLVTGRRMPELLEALPELDQVVDLVVAENGGLLYEPGHPDPEVLASAPPPEITRVLHACGADDIELGETLVSAPRELEIAVRRAARALKKRWPCTVVPNRDRVMLLPADVDKGTGLHQALERLAISPDEVIAIGDGENDVALLRAAGLGVAVADAVPALIAHADRLTRAAASAGVVETIEELLSA